jgi:Flp pilus assembly protein CpaB
MRCLLVLAALSMLATACSAANAAEPAPSALVPIMVATRDLPIGSKLTWDDMTQRSVPAGMVTSSVAKPDSSGFINNMVLLVPVLAGDRLLWSFVTTPARDALTPCENLQSEDSSAEQQVSRVRQIVLSHDR